MLAFDLWISQQFFSLGQAWPLWLVRFLATDLFWVLVAFVFFVSWRRAASHKSRGRFQLAVQAAGALALVWAVNAVIGWLYFRHRPFVDLMSSPLINVSALSKSFPSDHAAASFALATTIWLKQKKSGRWALLLALLIALGRVLAGVHYFSDVAVGAGLGAGLAYLVIILISFL